MAVCGGSAFGAGGSHFAGNSGFIERARSGREVATSFPNLRMAGGFGMVEFPIGRIALGEFRWMAARFGFSGVTLRGGFEQMVGL